MNGSKPDKMSLLEIIFFFFIMMIHEINISRLIMRNIEITLKVIIYVSI